MEERNGFVFLKRFSLKLSFNWHKNEDEEEQNEIDYSFHRLNNFRSAFIIRSGCYVFPWFQCNFYNIFPIRCFFYLYLIYSISKALKTLEIIDVDEYQVARSVCFMHILYIFLCDRKKKSSGKKAEKKP